MPRVGDCKCPERIERSVQDDSVGVQEDKVIATGFGGAQVDGAPVAHIVIEGDQDDFRATVGNGLDCAIA